MIIFDHKILQPWLKTFSVGANVAGTSRKFANTGYFQHLLPEMFTLVVYLYIISNLAVNYNYNCKYLRVETPITITITITQKLVMISN